MPDKKKKKKKAIRKTSTANAAPKTKKEEAAPKVAKKKKAVASKAPKKKAASKSNGMNPYRKGSKRQFMFDLLSSAGKESDPLTVDEIEAAMDAVGRETKPSVIRSWISGIRRIKGVTVNAERVEGSMTYSVTK